VGGDRVKKKHLSTNGDIESELRRGRGGGKKKTGKPTCRDLSPQVKKNKNKAGWGEAKPWITNRGQLGGGVSRKSATTKRWVRID